MVVRTWSAVAIWLTLGLPLAACTDLGEPATAPRAMMAPQEVPAGPPRVALLLPLTGPKADLAQSMLKGARLALAAPGSPLLDVQDTAGDANRAGVAAQQAMANGDRMILGPLTAEETAVVAPVAQAAGVPVLAFTSDPLAAAPGVWTLGLTPVQQMRRLVGAARDDGRQHLAAVLPQGALGDALQSAFGEAAMEAGLEPPVVERSEPGLSGFTAALKTISNYESRRGELEARIKALREETDPASRQQAAELAAKPVEPPPFDALLVGETGDTLLQVAEVLPAYDATGPQVRILGLALWAQQSGRLGKLAGGWYAALDPATRAPFLAAYQAHYGSPPSPFADYAFDAAAIARVLAGEADFSPAALTRAEGFTGVDGAMLLLPDGHVRRALAVWQIAPGGGARIVSPAPEDISQPAS
jgi:ABC-type branched-subunit amino acid transport system substrate-binding protein